MIYKLTDTKYGVAIYDIVEKLGKTYAYKLYGKDPWQKEYCYPNRIGVTLSVLNHYYTVEELTQVDKLEYL